jgi:hypothetical protein
LRARDRCDRDAALAWGKAALVSVALRYMHTPTECFALRTSRTRLLLAAFVRLAGTDHALVRERHVVHVAGRRPCAHEQRDEKKIRR